MGGASAGSNTAPAAHDLGRNLFAVNRRVVGPADQGAMSISCGPAAADGGPWEYDAGTSWGTMPQRRQRRMRRKTPEAKAAAGFPAWAERPGRDTP